MDGTKAASAAKLGGRVVHLDQFQVLLDQPRAIQPVHSQYTK